MRSRSTTLRAGMLFSTSVSILVLSAVTRSTTAIAQQPAPPQPSAVAQQTTQPSPGEAAQSAKQPAAPPQAGTTPLPPVTVTGEKPKKAKVAKTKNGTMQAPASTQAASVIETSSTKGSKEASEALGYKPSTVSTFGPFGQKPLLDVPYSVNVISSDLLENRMASSPEDAFRISPVVQLQGPNSRTLQNLPTLRGFGISTFAIDGMRMGGTGASLVATEDKERIEIITGLTGFLYGGSDVGGMINYVYKKPTSTQFAKVTAGNYGNLSKFVQLDAGGPVDSEGKLAYRLNIVGQDGELPTDPQELSRGLITAAFDWNITDGTKLQVLGSHHDAKLTGAGAYWVPQTVAGGASLFNYNIVPDPSKYWSQFYGERHTVDDRFEVSLVSKLSDIFTARAAYAFDRVRFSDMYSVGNYWLDNNGSYRQNAFLLPASLYDAQSAYAYLDAKFETGPIAHKLTIGANGDTSTFRNGAGSTTSANANYTLSQGPVYTAPSPTIVPTAASATYYGTEYVGSIRRQENYVIGDDISISNELSALVGVNYAIIDTTRFAGAPPFQQTSRVDQGRPSPTFSLIYKPLPWLSSYATYSESLQGGVIVPTSQTYTNAGEILAPYIGKEYEIGAKGDIGGVLWTAAIFNIDKANQFARANTNGTLTYVSDGRQIHKGIELTATGNLMEGLRIFGGLTLMDNEVAKTASPTTDGKRPVNVANEMVKLTVEYDLPFVKGLTVTGGVYQIGKQAADSISAVWLDPYITEDVGLRYRTQIPSGQEATFRFNVSNLTNEAYWQTNGYVGAPRTFAFSGSLEF